MIRDAKISDVPALVELGVKMHAKTVYGGLPIDEFECARVFRRAIGRGMSNCIVAVHDDVITGFILLEVCSYWWANADKGPRFVTDLATFSIKPGDGRRLVRAAIYWAKQQRKVVECTFQNSSGQHIETADRIYLAAGCRKIGGCYYIDLRGGHE